MLRDELVLIMGEEVGCWGGTYAVTRGFYGEFDGKRILDTPIAEEAIIGAAVGAAMGGLRPGAELMTINFSLVAMDQIVNNVAKIHSMFGSQARVPLVIRTPAGWGQLGATPSQSFEAWFCAVAYLRTLRPLDMAPVYDSVEKTHRALILEEDWTTCGMGAEIAARISRYRFDSPA